MNTIRTIEGATLMMIGIFCASAVVNIGLHGGKLLNANEAGTATTITAATAAATAAATTAAAVHLPTVTITAKRLNASAKAAELAREPAWAVLVEGSRKPADQG